MIWKDRYDKVKNFYKGHRKAVVGSVLGIGAIILAGLYIRGCGDDKDKTISTRKIEDKETIYSGDIEGRNVVYKENVDFEISGKKRKVNALFVGNRGDNYILIDYDLNNIEWEKNAARDFSTDRLERIVIQRDKAGKEITHVFDIDDINNNTITGSMVSNMIDKGSKYFIKMRGKIREKKRSDYVEEFSQDLEFFYSEVGEGTPSVSDPVITWPDG